MDTTNDRAREKFKSRFVPTFPDQKNRNLTELMKETFQEHEHQAQRQLAVLALVD